MKIIALFSSIIFLFVAGLEFLEACKLYSFAATQLARKRIGRTANCSVDLGDIRLESVGNSFTRSGSEYVSHLAPVVLYGRDPNVSEMELPNNDNDARTAEIEIKNTRDVPSDDCSPQLRHRLRHRSSEGSDDSSTADENNRDQRKYVQVGRRSHAATSMFQQHRLGHVDGEALDTTAEDPTHVQKGQEHQRQYQHESEVKDWEDLPVLVKLRIFDGWRMLTSFGMTLCWTF